MSFDIPVFIFMEAPHKYFQLSNRFSPLWKLVWLNSVREKHGIQAPILFPRAKVKRSIIPPGDTLSDVSSTVGEGIQPVGNAITRFVNGLGTVFG